MSTKPIAHDGNDMVCVSVCVQVEIAAEVGPVIQRFDHNNLAASILQSATNGIEKWKRMIYALTLVRNCPCGPFGHTIVAGGGHTLLQSSQGTHDYVIRTGERQEIGEFGIFGIGQSVGSVFSLGLAILLRRANCRIIPSTEEKLGKSSKKFGSAVWPHG